MHGVDLIEEDDVVGIEERLNVACVGPEKKRFRAEFISPGLINYRDCGGGIEYLPKETIDEALNQVIGIPLTVRHPDGPSSKKYRDFSGLTHGAADKVDYDPALGLYFAEGTCDTDVARERINAGERPSIGFSILRRAGPGVMNNIAYDSKITKIRFHHLAIVPNPRLEGSNIRLNSKNTPVMSTPKKFKIVSFLAALVGAASKDPVRSESEVGEDTELEIGGKAVRLNAIADAWRAKNKKLLEAKTPTVLKGDDIIVIDGQEVRLNDAMQCLEPVVEGTKTETEEEKKTRLAAEEVTRNNAATAEAARAKSVKDAADKKAQEDTARLNAEALQAAGAKSYKVLGAAKDLPVFGTVERVNDDGSMAAKLARGRQRYGGLLAGKN